MTPYDVITTVNTPASSYDLTDLATVKTELAIPSGDTSNDSWISAAITQVSTAIANYCQRAFPVEAVTDTFYFNRRWRAHQRTDDRDILQLTRFPVTGVTSVVETLSDGTTNTLVLGTDYVRKDNVGQLIRLNSDTGFTGHWRGSIVTVQYSAGYGAVVTEADTIPASPGPYTITVDEAPAFSIDQGVSYVGGAALVPVASSPAAGQYSVDVDTGVYTFAAADQGNQVAISYGYNDIPDDLIDAVLRMVTQRFKAKGRDPMQMTINQPGLGEVRYWVGSAPGQNGAFPPEIQGLLDGVYRVPVVG